MILALRRFKVTNGHEESMAHAFQNRPGVEQMEGFLGTKVLTERTDPPVFNPPFRWSIESAFPSNPHLGSHQSVPKGVKFDWTLARPVVLQHLCY
jgi:hypothetical protein